MNIDTLTQISGLLFLLTAVTGMLAFWADSKKLKVFALTYMVSLGAFILIMIISKDNYNQNPKPVTAEMITKTTENPL